MADKREKNVEIFQDSLSYIEEKEILKEAVRNSLENQTLYLESDEITLLPNPQKAGNVVISKKRSFEAAMDYAKKGTEGMCIKFCFSDQSWWWCNKRKFRAGRMPVQM